MKTKHLTGAYNAGYTLANNYSGVIVGSTAFIGGTGLTALQYANVTNLGTIASTPSNVGVELKGGGSVTNGSPSHTAALVTGQNGVYLSIGGIVHNYGTIQASGSTGVGLGSGTGTVINGSKYDNTALIIATYDGIIGHVTATIINYGTVEAIYTDGTSRFSVDLRGGGSVTNGSLTDVTALMSGSIYVYKSNAVTNFGTVTSTKFGVVLTDGTLTNGSASDTGALILGGRYWGVGIGSPGTTTVTNFGTILCTGHGNADGGNDGLDLAPGATVTNGSTLDSIALISGYNGVRGFGGGGTLTNFGTVKSTGGDAIYFQNAGDRLIAEAGSSWIGSVKGGGGTLELASGTGTITGLGATGTLSGAEAMTFSGFGAYQIDSGSSWAFTGPNSLAGTFFDNGTLTVDGATAVGKAKGVNSSLIVNGTLMHIGVGTSVVSPATTDNGLIEGGAGTLDFAGPLRGTGGLRIDSGATIETDGAAAKSLRTVFGGTDATLALKTPARFLATISGFAVGDSIDLLNINATGASLNSKNQLVIVNGTSTVATLRLSGNYIGATFTAGSDGHGGTAIAIQANANTSPPSTALFQQSPNALIAAMASFGALAGVALGTFADRTAASYPLVAAPSTASRTQTS